MRFTISNLESQLYTDSKGSYDQTLSEIKEKYEKWGFYLNRGSLEKTPYW